MIVRGDGPGALVVGQPAHAAMCGRFARAWGAPDLAPVLPLDAIALGAEQHDAGWAAHDLQPHLDPATGLPVDFLATPLEQGVALWRDGPRRLVSQSRWAALLAAMHGRRLYERIDLAARPAAQARAVRGLLAELDALIEELLAALRADPASAAGARAEAVRRAGDLVWCWDGLSLALLLGWAPRELGPGPGAGGAPVTIALARADGDPEAHTLSPWPFRDPDGITVGVEGRRLAGRARSQAELDRAWARAPWETVTFRLRPGPARG